ncbi:MAG: hypothetical protein BGO63_00325 [Candidatus Accumulibacter sp. 66-26]|nr:nitrogen fixation protein NifQ [Accumulibacter sp.]OJW47643.1 MAG: hypothetical protein BGO63_00325 [Candidatus Accumulibacter sp. 66-26]
MLTASPRHFAVTPFEPPSGALSRRVLDGVLGGAEDGSLPPFAATLGMSAAQFRREMKERTPRHHAAHALSDERFGALAAQAPGEFHVLLELLLGHAAPDVDAADANRLARAIAAACFGQRHLWQDLGLAGRTEVTELLERHFPRLARKNSRDLRWKRFLFAEVGALTGNPALRPPACTLCPEQQTCHRETPMA